MPLRQILLPTTKYLHLTYSLLGIHNSFSSQRESTFRLRQGRTVIDLAHSEFQDSVEHVTKSTSEEYQHTLIIKYLIGATQDKMIKESAIIRGGKKMINQ